MEIGGEAFNHEAPTSESVLIGPMAAMRIAAQWQSPGTEGSGMAQFASAGTVTDDLLDDIADEGASAQVEGRTSDVKELAELRAYVMACTVPVWTVGSNHAGYLPEGDVYAFLSYGDAVDAFTDAVREAPDVLAGTSETGGDCSDDGPCEPNGDCAIFCDFHMMEAEVGAYITDEVPGVVRGKVFVEPRELSIALRRESSALPTVYWLQRSERVVSDYVSEREGF